MQSYTVVHVPLFRRGGGVRVCVFHDEYLYV